MQSTQILDFMLNQIMKNPNTSIARQYLHYLILNNIYNETDIVTSEFIKVSFNGNHLIHEEQMNLTFNFIDKSKPLFVC